MEENVLEKLLENIQNDLKNISLEAKKKFPHVKESTEEAIIKIRSTSPSNESNIFQTSNQILYPLVQGCETKDGKVVKLCLNLIQRLIVHKVIDFKGARYITDTLWMLMEANIEEVKILQTLTLLITSSHVVQNDVLAKCLVICFRLNFTKDPTVNLVGGATVRQLIPSVFERVLTINEPCTLCLRHCHEEPSAHFVRLRSLSLHEKTDPFVADAFLMFQDIVTLVSGDQPVFLTGIVEMTRTFGLELLESILTKFPSVFKTYGEFKILLKEKVCSLVIKLFSPNIKYKANHPAHLVQGPGQDKPYYPITSKLLRVVSILILEYHSILTTESEIFLSLILKFLDPDKPAWQNCIALEVLHKIIVKQQILAFICKEFDMKDHSTNVLQDMVNGLGAYVQNVMFSSGGAGPESPDMPQSQAQSPPNHPVYGPGLSPQPGFFHRDVWKPLTISFIGGQTKELFLDVADKQEQPTVSDGYGISLAYVGLLDTVRSISLLFDADEPDQSYRKKMIESTWCGILTALSLLLDASTDDTSTECILKSLELYASLCGRLKETKPRDAYLAAICKASLPPHYTLTVLKATPSTQTVSGPRDAAGASMGLHENDIRHQVVAVGTPLPTSSLPTSAHQGPVMLTSKNLQCMRAILSVAHCHGNLLGSSWHIILTSLQHLVWILGLKPIASGSLASSSSASSENSSVITTAVMADLPVLSNMVTRLFESSCDLEDASVQHLIDALCRLSEESMELASSNREPSLFAVAKLLETAMVNLSRTDIVWRPITNHLLIVCQHPHLRMRQWGCEALTFLTKQSLQHKYDPPLDENLRLQNLLLSPLAELCAIPFPDVRQKQLDTVLHVLHTSGETLNQGWPLVLTIIGNLDADHSDILVRNAFQCLQLVFADFLPTIPYRCYPQCVETAAKFGAQKAELNVSLTAIGLLWNLSDYFYQNVTSLQDQKIGDGVVFPEFPGCKDMPTFDKLWMCLYCKLKDLCLDSRPAVRKSAGQTLFSTIAAHGSVLHSGTWQAVLWQVLFPLLDNVIIQSDNASSEKVSQSQVIMIHHSRNTAQKQWAETKVLTISGVVRVFNTKRKLLKTMTDYSKAWVLLLEYVEKMALSDTAEVSLAALKAMQEMITTSTEEESMKDINWTLCWKAWLNIGNHKTSFMSNSATETHNQAILTGYVQIFLCLFPLIEVNFRRTDVEHLGSVLSACAEVAPMGDSDCYNQLSVLHTSILEALTLVKRKQTEAIVPDVFNIYFKLGRNALKDKPKSAVFGVTCLEEIESFYVSTCAMDSVVAENILSKIVHVLAIPLEVRYQTQKQNNWKVAVNVLIKCLRKGLPLARQFPEKFTTLWSPLVKLLAAFLFPDSLEHQRQEDRIADEAIDCHLIELLREEVLPFPSAIPPTFIREIVILLNKGSIHSSMRLTEDCSGTTGLREDFARHCFETLLEFSLLDSDIAGPAATSDGLTNRLAITSLLQRFKEVLQDAIEGEKLNRNIPLQRQKCAEISFVLKAIATVISSMKKAQKVDEQTWKQIIGLYPHLVQFTETASPQISSSVKYALLEYGDLLQPLKQ